MKHPGHWQHFILRNDNRGLTTEQMRQKYVKESQLFEQFISYQMQQQLIMANATSAGGGSNVSSGPINTNFLLQENGDFLLQEDGSKIIME